MTTAFWCILIAGALPYVAVLIAKWDKSMRANNHDPRAWEAKFTGLRARALNAHMNSFEAFPLFAAGVIVATLAKAPAATVDGIAIAFVVARALYLACYVANLATLRSLVWLAGIGLAVSLFFLAPAVR